MLVRFVGEPDTANMLLPRPGTMAAYQAFAVSEGASIGQPPAGSAEVTLPGAEKKRAWPPTSVPTLALKVPFMMLVTGIPVPDVVTMKLLGDVSTA